MLHFLATMLLLRLDVFRIVARPIKNHDHIIRVDAVVGSNSLLKSADSHDRIYSDLENFFCFFVINAHDIGHVELRAEGAWRWLNEVAQRFDVRNLCVVILTRL